MTRRVFLQWVATISIAHVVLGQSPWLRALRPARRSTPSNRSDQPVDRPYSYPDGRYVSCAGCRGMGYLDGLDHMLPISVPVICDECVGDGYVWDVDI